MAKEVGGGKTAPKIADPWTWLLDPAIIPIAPRITMPTGTVPTVSIPPSSLRVTATEPLRGSTTRPIGAVLPTPRTPIPTPTVSTATYTTHLPEVRSVSPRYRFEDVMSEGMWGGAVAAPATSRKLIPKKKSKATMPTPPGGTGGGYVPSAPSAPTEEGGGGGGEGGGGGGGGATEVTPSLLGELSWWANADVLQPLLRGWGGWLKELIEQNRLTQAIPNPFAVSPEAEAAAAELPTEAGAPAAAGYTSSRGVIDRLKTLLGLEFEEGESSTSQWQKVINAIPKADFEAQQLLASLRFDPTGNQWYTVDVGQLVNPRYT